MKYDPNELKNLPEIITKEQLRKVCHISKRTALFLLKSGLIPNENTGKKTRCYRIKKADVIKYLQERENDPCKFQAPENWYKNAYGFKPHTIRLIPSEKATKQVMTAYYKQQLQGYSDVMTVADICDFTGYNRRAVGRWCVKKRLKYITSTPKYLVPKTFLIEYLTSDCYNNTIRKSKKHIAALWDMQGFYCFENAICEQGGEQA